MYASESIMIYYEIPGSVPQVRCAVFKWVNAGWAGINMVKPHHIRSGVERFVKTFKQVIESGALPQPSELAANIRHISELSVDDLRERVREYYNALKKQHENDNHLNRKWFPRLFGDDTYVENMNHEELKAVVCKEYLKYLLGKSHGFDLALFNRNREKSKHPG